MILASSDPSGSDTWLPPHRRSWYASVEDSTLPSSMIARVTPARGRSDPIAVRRILLRWALLNDYSFFPLISEFVFAVWFIIFDSNPASGRKWDLVVGWVLANRNYHAWAKLKVLFILSENPKYGVGGSIQCLEIGRLWHCAKMILLHICNRVLLLQY